MQVELATGIGVDSHGDGAAVHRVARGEPCAAAPEAESATTALKASASQLRRLTSRCGLADEPAADVGVGARPAGTRGW